MRLEAAFYNKILNLKAGSRNTSSGVLVNNLRELETLRDFFTSATLTTIVDLPFVVIFIALFAYIGGHISFIFLLSIPIIVLIALAIHYPMQRSIEKSYAAGTQKHSILIETTCNFEAVKALHCAPSLRTRWNGYVAESAKQTINCRTLSMASLTFTGLVQQLSYAGIFLIGVYLIGKGEMTVGGLVACSILSGRITAPLIIMAQLITRLHHTLNSYRELNKIMTLDEERPAEKAYLHRSQFTGAVAFSRVGFSYPDTNILVLDNVSLNIRAGEKVGIIGRTGSGKTTLGKLLLGLYEPTQGAVLLDGTDLRQIDPLDSRRCIGYVPQEVGLFRGTVRSNIIMGYPPARDQEILQAAELAGVTDFLNTHPAGFDLPINEQGGGLSGVQRQAVTIARAIVNNPQILVMDEPTSSMDNRSEATLVAKLRPRLSGKTLVLITHRESLLVLVDRIVIMDSGKIVADGPKNMIMDKLCAGNIQVQNPQ